MKSLNKIFAIVALCFLYVGCSQDDNSTTPDFDRKAVLADQATIIVNSFSSLQSTTESLNNNITDFVYNPTVSGLEIARNSLYEARLAYQMCSPYSSFGPSNSSALRTELNTYPSDTSSIEQNLSTGQYTLGSVANLDAQGFPAIEYLLWSENSTQATVDAFSNSSNRGDYLLALSSRCADLASGVYADWNSNYSSIYREQDGTDVGSSLGLVVNSLNLDYEKYIRDGKVGIPLGIRSLGNPLPGHIESPYSGNSKALLKASLQGLLQLIDGSTANSASLSTYMDHVNAQHSGSALSGVIRNHINGLITQVDAVDRPLETWLIEESSAADQMYSDLQQLVIYLKVDMTSSLGILISYQDTDGD